MARVEESRRKGAVEVRSWKRDLLFLCRLCIIREDAETKKQVGLTESISGQMLRVPEKDREEFPALQTVENNKEILVCLQVSEAETSGSQAVKEQLTSIP